MLHDILFWFIRFLPSSLRRKLYLSLRRLSIKIYGPTHFFVQRLPLGIYLKQGHMAAQEALTIRLIAKYNSSCKSSDETILVPKILDVVDGAFLMTRVEGEVLGNLFSKMNEDKVAQVRQELGKLVRNLRAISCFDAAAKDIDLGMVSGPTSELPCCDVNRVDELEFGPFPSVAAFHSYLLQSLPPDVPLKERFSIAHGLSSQTGANEGNSNNHYPTSKAVEPVFTHGDLNLRNILITRRSSPSASSKSSSTSITLGIVDWTCAGWYPIYWEHTKAIYIHRRFKMWTDLWAGIAEDTVPEEHKGRYKKQVELEKEMWRYID